MYELEVRLGVTRGRPQTESEPHDTNLSQCSPLVTTLVYLERRSSSVKSLADEVDQQLVSLASFVIFASHPQMKFSNLYLTDVVSNGIWQPRHHGFDCCRQIDSSAMKATAALTMGEAPPLQLDCLVR